MSKSSKQNELHEAVLNGLHDLVEKVDKVRTEDIPGIHTRMALIEQTVANLKDDVRKEAKRDAKIYGGFGSAVAGLLAIALTYIRH